MKQKKEKLGLSWIVVALIFLFNPNLHLIDPLPDFLGYLFLCFAFSKLADLNEDIESAVSAFRKMIWIDASKWLAIFITFTMSASGEKNSSVLLWTFVFSILELLFLIPAYSKLFYAISKLGYFHPNSSILGTVKKKKSATDRAKKMTLVFVIVKSTFTVLPEFADLSNNAYYDGNGMTSLYRYIGLLRGFSILIVLIFGIVWLCRLQHYFYRLRHDRELMISLSDAYRTNVKPQMGKFIQRRFKYACFFLILGLVFSMDYRLDNVSFFPDFFSAVALTFVFVTLSRNVSIKKAPWIAASSVYLVAAVISDRYENKFFTQYSLNSMLKNDKAAEIYYAYVLCNLVTVLAFLLVIFFIYRTLSQMILTHTGTMIGKEYVDERVISMEKELHTELRRPLRWAMLSALLYGISDICYDFFAPMLSNIYVEGTEMVGSFSNVQNHYGWLKTTNLLLLILCIVLYLRATYLILSEIRAKYMLE